MDLLHSAKDIKRLNELAAILIKYGFSDLIYRLQLNESLLQIGKLMRIQMPENLLSQRPAERARSALEEMGPTFIKLGQLLATRIDLISQEWTQSFEQLQDSAPALPFAQIKPTLVEALGSSFEKDFQFIDPSPLGSASMAQVHRAITRTNNTIILKIRKPQVREKIEADLRLMHQLARLAEQQSPELRRFNPMNLVKEFERSLLSELDFSLEARNAEKIAKNLHQFKFLKIPKVYWQWTSETVNAQEYIQGIPARDTEKLDNENYSRKKIVQRGAQIIWKMMLIDGFFHADPHPGNFLVLPKNNIAMLDFGMTGRLTRSRKQQLYHLLHNVVMRNSEEVTTLLSQWSHTPLLSKDQMILDVENFIDRYYGLSLNQIPIPQIIHDSTALLRNYDIQMPPDIALFCKTCITLEGFGRLLYPEFNLTSEAQPLIEKAIRDSLKPNHIAKEGFRLFTKSIDRFYQYINTPTTTTNKPLASSTPTIDKGTLEQLTTRIEKAIYRLIQGTLLASLFIGSAVVATIPIGPQLFGMHALGVLGFFAVAASSGWLLLLMWWTLRGRR